MNSVGDDDEMTVLLAIAGSGEAFDALVRRYQGPLGQLLRRACGDAALAEDVAQIAFVRAWRRLGALREPRTFYPWLRRIALNAAVDMARKRALESRATALGAGETLSSPNNSSDKKLDIEVALMRLSFHQRACIQLSLGEGMSHSEIAEALKIPIGTVKSHIARALPLLREALEGWKVRNE